jgi:outer membrane protein assembly factor BamB
MFGTHFKSRFLVAFSGPSRSHPSASRRRNLRLLAFALPLIVAAASPLRADDWPNWRGPNHNGISSETGWLAKWPADGPPRLWKASVGLGFSSVTVSKGRAYTMGNQKDTDTVFCFDAETGKLVWKHSYACPTAPLFYEGGTSATPTVDGNNVYTLSKKGDLFCFAADTGKIIWSKNVATELSLDVPTWGFASSALIEGKLLLLNVGSFGTAFDKSTGKVLWTTGKTASGYSTPVPCTFGGKPALALVTGSGAVGVDMAAGGKLWEYLWKTDYNINVAEPIPVGDQVFVSSSYGRTCALLQIQGGTAKALWRNSNMCNQINSCVLVDGYLYGVNGVAGPTPNASLRCVDWQTGSVKWNYPDLGGGALTVADGKIIAMSDKGELFTAAVSPQSFTPISRVQVLGGRCWTVPVLANGRIYCRSGRGDLVCLDVKPH